MAAAGADAHIDATGTEVPASGLRQRRGGSGAAAGDGGSQVEAAWPARDDCLYASSYCEENVWHLAAALAARPLPGWQMWVVFISNASKSVPLWRQRLAVASPGAATLWDYHVLLLAAKAGQATLVLDLDTTLPFPCSLEEYRRGALLGGDGGLPPQFRRSYRVVAATWFLRHFSSDRSHMINQDAGGGWLQPPPSWPCIAGEPGGPPNTLPAYLDFPADDCQQQQAEQQHAAQRAEQQAEQQHDGGGGPGALAAAAAGPLGLVLPETAFLSAFGVR